MCKKRKKRKSEPRSDYKESPRKWMIFNRFRLKWIVRVPPADCVGGAIHVCCVDTVEEAIKCQDAEFEKLGTSYKEMLEIYKTRVVSRCRFSNRCRDPQFMKRYENAVEQLSDEQVDKFLES